MNIRQTGFHLWPERQKITAPDCLPSHLFFYYFSGNKNLRLAEPCFFVPFKNKKGYF